MNKKVYLVSFGCAFFGLILGAGITYVAVTIHYGKITADAMLAVKAAEHYKSVERAAEAYYTDSRPVAIYALSEHLVTLEEAAKLPDTPFTPQHAITSTLVLTHGRLAKLYAESGQTNLSVEHIAKALSYSKNTHRALTNETDLADYIATMDPIIYPNLRN